MNALSEPLPAPTPEQPAPTPVNDSGRPEIRAGGAALLLFFGLFLGWAAFAPLDAAVVAPGVVVVSGNRQTVQHRDGGTVSRINVREGQEVKAGDILIELAAPELLAQEQALLSQMLDLQLRRQRIVGEMSGAARIEPPREWAALTPEDRAVADEVMRRHELAYGRGRPRTEFQTRINGYREELVSVQRQERLLQDELVGIRTLAERGLVPMTRLRALERAEAELQGRQAELRAQIAVSQQGRGEDLREIEATLASTIPQFRAAREQVERTRLRAPVSGAVVGLAVHTVGGVIGGGERVMDIVPDDRELVIEAQVRPVDADDVHPGMTTEVRITAFHGREMPIVDGTVRQISADRFTDERTGNAYFIAQVVVPENELARLAEGPRARALSAGLPADVVIPTRKRVALQYLLEPLDQTLWRSFRED